MASFLHNIGFANKGIVYFFKSERNGRIQAFIAVIIIGAGFFFHITSVEWCLILVCVAMVIGLEMINTALERTCEMLSKEYHPMVKIIKDVAAGAVWFTSLIAALIGAIIFYPYAVKLFNA